MFNSLQPYGVEGVTKDRPLTHPELTMLAVTKCYGLISFLNCTFLLSCDNVC